MQARIDGLRVAAYRVPTDAPESDGTHAWNATTIVVVEVRAGTVWGLGYTYADAATAVLIAEKLRETVVGHDAMAIVGAGEALAAKTRNLGWPGLVSAGVSAVDTALWDLKARLLGVSLVELLGAHRDGVPVYGSGGFTSYSTDRLCAQLAGWVEQRIGRVKMKVGREPREDVARVRAVRQAIGPDAELFVDANGAYSRKQALAKAEVFAEFAVTWFEEPVSSDDLEGLRLLRDRAPAGMEIAAGEYGYDLFDFRRMLDAGAVDVLMPDGTRCGGITGFLQAGTLCEAWTLPMSAHTAPALHAHVGCAVIPVRHIEYFHDHVRIEQKFFGGLPKLHEGALYPDRSRPGLGLEFKRADAEPYLVYRGE